MLGTYIAIVITLIALIATYVLGVMVLKPIIRDIAHNTRWFCKSYDELTNEAIKNITWKQHDRLFWVITAVWLLSMILGAIFTVIMFMNFWII